jgi:F0F1-type ATP synthase membrane subunit c/vacuolar-type H+-ATPase subunit K
MDINSSQKKPGTKPSVNTLQVITIAFIFTTIVFNVVVLQLVPAQINFTLTEPLHYLFVGLAIFLLVIAFAFRELAINRKAHTVEFIDEEKILEFYTPRHIISMALIEAATIFTFVVALLAHNPTYLHLISTLAIAGYIAFLPTPARLNGKFNIKTFGKSLK